MIVLLGSSGFVGTAFRKALQHSGREVRCVRRCEINYGQVDSLIALLRDLKPGFLINSAGYTGKPNVDACEDHKAECLHGNAVLPGQIREACEATGTRWGHVSSGCIFTGERPGGGGFTEADAPNFCFRTDHCSFYSGTKALGEEILEGAENCYIWRLRIPFDEIDGSRNYLSKVVRYERLLDARNSLSHLGEFVNAAIACFDQNVTCGTYNLTNGGSITTREVVELVKATGIYDQDFQFFESESEFMQQAARTPRSNCVLDNSKALAAGLKLSPVHDRIERSLAEWVPEC